MNRPYKRLTRAPGDFYWSSRVYDWTDFMGDPRESRIAPERFRERVVVESARIKDWDLLGPDL